MWWHRWNTIYWPCCLQDLNNFLKRRNYRRWGRRNLVSRVISTLDTGSTSRECCEYCQWITESRISWVLWASHVWFRLFLHRKIAPDTLHWINWFVPSIATVWLVWHSDVSIASPSLFYRVRLEFSSFFFVRLFAICRVRNQCLNAGSRWETYLGWRAVQLGVVDRCCNEELVSLEGVHMVELAMCFISFGRKHFLRWYMYQ